jgi:serine/threonine protein kinase
MATDRATATQDEADDYLARLRASGLIVTDELEQVLSAFCDETGELTITGESLGQRLVARGRLTAWQHEQLIAGRTQFFLGNYELLSFVGRGGYGEVFRARHRHMGREVAVKVLPAALTGSDVHRRRFYRESQAAAYLHHPNIVQVFDVDERDGTHYMVMEYVRGPCLRDLVRQRGVLPVRTAMDYVRQAALGLAHAHSRGLIHRDVKPSNLLLDEGGVVKISDLGIAYVPHEGDSPSILGGPNSVFGTLDYQPPEQWEDSHHVDARADLYSLGCTLCYLLTGEPPFPRGTPAQRVQQHQLAEPPDLHALRADVPEAVVAIFERLLAKKPEERIAQASELAEGIGKWLDQSTPAAPSPQAPNEQAIQLRHRQEIREEQLRELVSERLLTPLQCDILRSRRWEPLHVGSYQLLERIEDGRLAGLYRGRHAVWQMPVMLRLIRLSEDAETADSERDWFGRGMRVASQVTHPNVVRTYDFGEDSGVCFAVFEPLVGKSLDELIADRTPASLSDLCRIIRDAATGLAHLHALGIVHRQTSPRNIWLDESGRVKLLDFDLASDGLHRLDEDTSVLQESAPANTHARGEHGAVSAQPADDVLALGSTFYRALSRNTPWDDSADADWVAPSHWNPDVPAELDELCQEMLSADPDARPQAVDVARALWTFLSPSSLGDL